MTSDGIPTQCRPLLHVLLTHAYYGAMYTVRDTNGGSYLVVDLDRSSTLAEWGTEFLRVRGYLHLEPTPSEQADMRQFRIALTSEGHDLLVSWNAELLGIDPINAD